MKEDFTKDPLLTYTLSEILGVRLISNDPSIFKTSEGGACITLPTTCAGTMA